MDNNSTMSPADFAAMANNGGFGGGANAWWIYPARRFHL